MQLIFNRKITRKTPGRFRTRILTQDVTPSLNVYYKNTRIKQYHKENRALRTETTINNSYDFGIGKRLHNLPKLREIGFAANRRLLEVERLSHDCMLAEDTFQAINSPVAPGRQRASGLRFADPRVHALWHAVILFRQLAQGFRSADLRQHLAALSGRDPQVHLPRRHHLSTAPPAPARLDRAPAQQLPLSRHRTSASALPCSSPAPTTASCAPASPPPFPALRANPPPLKRAFDKIDAQLNAGSIKPNSPHET